MRPPPPHSVLSELGLREGYNLALLKALHILTPDGRLNQDSRRKLKQVKHLLQFIEPLVARMQHARGSVTLVDHGAGKSYLGFMLYEQFFAPHARAGGPLGQVIGVEARQDLVERSAALARQFGFEGMRFVHASVENSGSQLPQKVDIVTALHACDTATDDAIAFALRHEAQHLAIVPCCQAEVAAHLNQHKSSALNNNPLVELWRRPLHTREFGSQLTNVLRCLQLEAHGFEVTVTELVGWEHSMKNELILASKGRPHARSSAQRLGSLLHQTGLQGLSQRFFTSLTEPSGAAAQPDS